MSSMPKSEKGNNSVKFCQKNVTSIQEIIFFVVARPC